MRSARFCPIFTNAFGPVHRAFVSKQKPLPVRLSICSSNCKTVGQHWECIIAYFDRRPTQRTHHFCRVSWGRKGEAHRAKPCRKRCEGRIVREAALRKDAQFDEDAYTCKAEISGFRIAATYKLEGRDGQFLIRAVSQRRGENQMNAATHRLLNLCSDCIEKKLSVFTLPAA